MIARKRNADVMRVLILTLFAGPTFIIVCFDRLEATTLSKGLAALRYWPASRQKSSVF